MESCFETRRDVVMQQPGIASFVQVTDQITSDRKLDFSDLEAPSFFPFWKNLVIMKRIVAEDDFVCVFCGTSVVEAFGSEMTGRKLTEIMAAGPTEEIVEHHLEALSTGGQTFASGRLYWEHKNFQNFHQIKMPMKRGETVEETLTFICFS